MADYWKSQPKKFCQYCKCWIADNKPSVEFHERGKNHKENVAAKITEIKQKSLDKAKQEARMSKDFAAMEAAAQIAFEGDMKRIEMESGRSQAEVHKGSQAQKKPTTTTAAAATATTTTTTTTTKKKNRAITIKAQPPPYEQEKSQKGAKRRKLREHMQSKVWVEGQTEDGHAYYYNSITGESKWERPERFQGQNSNSAQLGQSEISCGGMWLEMASPDGYTYYYNNETGESRWERPAHLPAKEMECQPEPPGTLLVAHTEGKESSGADQASTEADGNGQTSQEPIASQISIREKSAEIEPSEKEGEEEAVPAQKKDEGEEEEEEEEKVQKPPPVIEEKKPKIVIQVRKQKKSTAYGAWEKIKQEVDPYASVDLQLPQVDNTSIAEELPPEPKPKFRERTITSLGDERGPTSFKKSKTQNGKSRSLRQRGKDD